MPRHWRGRAHTREVQGAFNGLFQFKAGLLGEEMLSILATPFVLYFSLPRCAGASLGTDVCRVHCDKARQQSPSHARRWSRRVARLSMNSADEAYVRRRRRRALSSAVTLGCSAGACHHLQLHCLIHGRWGADAIVAFVRDNTVAVEGLGDVCSLATFDLARHGNPRYGSPVACPKVL
jgi:Autophagy protein ATG9